MELCQGDLRVAAVRSDLEPWPARKSPSASSLSSVFCASCRRSAAEPWADCWTTPGTWSRNGWSRYRHRRRRHHRRLLCRWDPLLVSSWAERLPVFERLLETKNNKKMFKILIFCRETGNKDARKRLVVHTWRLWTNGLQSQVLGVNFALVVRLGHHRRGELHVTHLTDLRSVRVSVVAVWLLEPQTMKQPCFPFTHYKQTLVLYGEYWT